MKLYTVYYGDLTREPGLKPNQENARADIGYLINQELQNRIVEANIVEYSSISEILTRVYSTMFLPVLDTENKTYGSVVFLDFDSDTSQATHDERIARIESELGIRINATYASHSFDASSNKFKLRYLLRFNRDLSEHEYVSIAKYFAIRFGADRQHSSPRRRTYGSGLTSESRMYSEFENDADELLRLVEPVLDTEQRRIEAEQRSILEAVEQVAESFEELPHIRAFFELDNDADFRSWAFRTADQFGLDPEESGRYMTTFVTVVNAAKTFLGEDCDLLTRVYAKFVALYPGGKNRLRQLKYRRTYKYGFVNAMIRRQLGEMVDDYGLLGLYGRPEVVKKHISVASVSTWLKRHRAHGIKLALFAQAGQGKTFATIRALNDLKKSYLFVMPTTAITNNQEAAVRRVLLDDPRFMKLVIDADELGFESEELANLVNDKETVFYHGKNPVNERVDSYRAVFATYDQIDNYLRHSTRVRDVLVIDEAHLLGQYQGISEQKRQRIRRLVYTSDRFDQQLHLTATPQALPDVYTSTLSFVRESNKPVTLYLANPGTNASKIDKPLFLDELFTRVVEAELIDVEKAKCLIFCPYAVRELTAFADRIADRYHVKPEVICSANKEDSDVYRALVYESGVFDANIVIATSILNTGVDIHDVFDYIIVLQDKNVATLLQAMNRDRSDSTRVVFAMHDCVRREYVWSDELEESVVVRGAYTDIPRVDYQHKIWNIDSKRTQVASRRQLLDRFLHGADNEPFELQYAAFNDYTRLCVTPRVIKDVFAKLNVQVEIRELGVVATTGAIDPDNELDFDASYHVSRDVLIQQILELRLETREAKGDEYPLRRDLARFSDVSEYRAFEAFVRLIAKAEILKSVDESRLADAVLKLDCTFRSETRITKLVKLYRELGVDTVIERVLERVLDVKLTNKEYRAVVIPELRGYLVASESANYGRTAIEKMLEDLDYRICDWRENRTLDDGSRSNVRGKIISKS